MTPETESALFQSLGRIEGKLEDLSGPQGRITQIEIKSTQLATTVESHERIVVFGKWLGIPILGVLHIGFRKLLGRL